MMIHPQIVNPDVTRHIVKTFGLQIKKKLGQNFLINASVLNSIIDGAHIAAGDDVLEVGPGIGTLTQALADTGAHVTAVELDEHLLPILAKTLEGYDNVRVVHGDILKVNIPELMDNRPCKVVANLPYYITTPILLALLESRYPFSTIVTMVQKEVAERMVARPGGKDYGALSVAVQYYTEPQMLTVVKPEAFFPPPSVESAVVCCTLRSRPPVDVCSERLFFRVVKAAFGQRRKTLANALKSMAYTAEQIKHGLDQACIDPVRRGETLSLQEFAAIANQLGLEQNEQP